jgi:hypothetical protein
MYKILVICAFCLLPLLVFFLTQIYSRKQQIRGSAFSPIPNAESTNDSLVELKYNKTKYQIKEQ